MSAPTLRQMICEDLFITSNQLDRLIRRAPHTYKVYTIPKKSGGNRVIAQPAKETKYLQNWLIHNLFEKLAVHECATAYKSGASIRKNAATHAGNSYLAKFDFKDFFTSIKEADLKSHFHAHLADFISEEEIGDAARISCVQHYSGSPLCLSVGAPSSPILSNSLLYKFDFLLEDWCSNNGITFTRYADDLSFSTNTPRLSSEVEPMVREIMTQLEYPALSINSKKTIHLSRKSQRRITGLILTNSGKVSIGREKKRMISALIHKHSLGEIEEEQLVRLQGLLGFAMDVEPIFVARMRKKYNSQLIADILSIRKPK